MDGSFPDSKGDKTMVVKCEDVWREISNYFEGDLDPALKLAMEEHFAQCTGCQSVRDGMRNVIELYGDKAMFTLPAGFYPRLHDRLADQVEGRKISRRAWLVSVAVTGAPLDFLVNEFFLHLFLDAKVNQPFELQNNIESIDLRPNGVRVTIRK